MAFNGSQSDWALFVNDVCSFLIASLADGLLIRRCFNVWDRSFRAIALSTFLLFCEIGALYNDVKLQFFIGLTYLQALDLSVIIIEAVTNFNFSNSQVKIIFALIGTSFSVTFATTLVTTLLIAYQIHYFSLQDVLQRPRSRFNYILEILVQSAAAYSVVTLAYAIITVFPTTDNDFTKINTANSYVGPFYFFISGFEPTIMVARIALAVGTNTNISAVTHVSGLQFRSTALNNTQLGRASIQIANEDQQLPREPKESEAKDEGTLHIG